jgi:hypothetical protein
VACCWPVLGARTARLQHSAMQRQGTGEACSPCTSSTLSTSAVGSAHVHLRCGPVGREVGMQAAACRLPAALLTIHAYVHRPCGCCLIGGGELALLLALAGWGRTLVWRPQLAADLPHILALLEAQPGRAGCCARAGSWRLASCSGSVHVHKRHILFSGFTSSLALACVVRGACFRSSECGGVSDWSSGGLQRVRGCAVVLTGPTSVGPCPPHPGPPPPDRPCTR